MKLIDTVNTKFLTPLHFEKIAIIDNTNFSKVMKKTGQELRKLGHEVTDDFLQKGILSLKQYYCVALLDPQNYHAVGFKVDIFWHTHMLFSQEYSEFCESVIGSYMHHSPLDHDSKNEVEAVRDGYNYTIDVYRLIYCHIDEEFTPFRLPDNQLICIHFCSTYTNGGIIEDSILPRNEELHKVFATDY